MSFLSSQAQIVHDRLGSFTVLAWIEECSYFLEQALIYDISLFVFSWTKF